MPTIEPTASDRAGSIVVPGTGRVAVSPDVADVRLGVSLTRPTVEAARAEAAASMDAILAAIDSAGVERRDVRTTLLSVQPQYDYRDGRAPRLVGYQLANAVDVTVRDLGRLGDVVDGTLGAGATSLDRLSFRVADPSDAERDARLAAMADARSRADVLAAAAGLTILGVSDVVEGAAAASPLPRFRELHVAMADASTPIEAGTTEIVVGVTVSYRTS
jgi:uncharacterized protein YggE